MKTETIQEIINFLCQELGGDWFLTGGALVRLKFDSSRGTEDLDFVRINHPTLSDEAAKDIFFRWLMNKNLGPEWVNSAVEPFVKEVPNWQKETVLIEKGSKGRIFRPNQTLFIYLKLKRGSEIDFNDILIAKKKCSEKFDEKKFLSWADEKLKNKFLKFRDSLGL